MRAPHSLRVPLAFGLTVFTGFLVLLALWLFGEWPTDKGLFDYRSATLGDALLLPLLVATLAGAIVSLPAAANDRRWAAIAFAGGAFAGALTQALWLLDNSPQLNWTLPAPHEFNAAGWYHAAFLALVSGLIAGLAVVAALRVRRARREGMTRARLIAASPWLGMLFACGLTFVGLLLADNADASGTSAGIATYVGIGFAALAGVAVLAWALGPLLRLAAANLAVGFAAAAGASALGLWGLQAPSGIAIAAIAAAVLIGLALSAIEAGRPPQLGRALAAVLVLLGGAAASFAAAADRGDVAAVAIAAAAGVAIWIGDPRGRRSRREDLLVGFAVFYVFGTLTLAAWLSGRPADQTEAAIAIGATLTVLDAVVISLVRNRFEAFKTDAQRARREGGRVDIAGNQSGDANDTWALIVGVGLSALAALAVLFSVAAPSLGADDVAGGAASGLEAWLVGDALLLFLAGIAVTVALIQRPEQLEFRPWTLSQLSPGAVAICLIVAAGAVALAATQFRAPLHDPLAALIAALALAILVSEDLLRSTLRLQLAKPGPAVWAVAIAGGAMVGMGVFWLLSVGLWDGARPASAAGALKSCGLTLLALPLCAGGFGVVVSMGLRTPHLTEQPPWLNASVQQLMYAALALIVVAIPFFVAGRLSAHPDLDNAGLVTLASLGFIPALLGAVLWILGNNAEHGRSEEQNPLPSGVGKVLQNTRWEPEAVNDLRKRELWAHIRFTNRLVGGLMAGGVLWIVVNLP